MQLVIFYSYLMLHTCTAIFDVTENLEKFLDFRCNLTSLEKQAEGLTEFPEPVFKFGRNKAIYLFLLYLKSL